MNVLINYSVRDYCLEFAADEKAMVKILGLKAAEDTDMISFGKADIVFEMAVDSERSMARSQNTQNSVALRCARFAFRLAMPLLLSRILYRYVCHDEQRPYIQYGCVPLHPALTRLAYHLAQPATRDPLLCKTVSKSGQPMATTAHSKFHIEKVKSRFMLETTLQSSVQCGGIDRVYVCVIP